MISHTLKYIFIHIPKTGGNSLQTFLIDSSSNVVKGKGNEWGPTEGLSVFPEKDVKHPEDWEIKHEDINYYYRYYSYGLVDNYIKFSIIRNPYDRAISHYFFRKGREFPDFDKKEFISWLTKAQLFNPNEKHVVANVQKNQIDYLMFGGKMSMDYIIKFENLKEDLNKIPFIKNMDLTDYPHLNASKRNNYRDYYDDETKSLVEKIYKKDLDYFKYKF